ncbi:MAG: ATP-binding protein [Paucibacter sp.]|nr:ATP-binding protein [Roseateles sp.]
MSALLIAIVGAESTGKTTLAARLSEAVAQRTGLRCTSVAEEVRLFCDREGRVPRQDEQAGIAGAQAAAIEAAARAHDLVFCDTTPLMTAVYSELIFNDHSLIEPALAFQRRCALTLVTALDIAWEPDGLIRDGPHVRAPVDALILAALESGHIPWQRVTGSGPARLEAALAAVLPLCVRR